MFICSKCVLKSNVAFCIWMVIHVTNSSVIEMVGSYLQLKMTWARVMQICWMLVTFDQIEMDSINEYTLTNLNSAGFRLRSITIKAYISPFSQLTSSRQNGTVVVGGFKLFLVNVKKNRCISKCGEWRQFIGAVFPQYNEKNIRIHIHARSCTHCCPVVAWFYCIISPYVCLWVNVFAYYVGLE